MALKLSENADGSITLRAKVVPGSSRDRVVGELGEELKIAVRKPPQDGAANAAVIKLLAEWLGISGRQIQIVRGHSNAHKEIVIHGVEIAGVLSRLEPS